ncbi:MAG: hydrolase [Caulobacteraceae bacterium]|nr:hydrolase [Caulobacteraceae bacterium]
MSNLFSIPDRAPFGAGGEAQDNTARKLRTPRGGLLGRVATTLGRPPWIILLCASLLAVNVEADRAGATGADKANGQFYSIDGRRMRMVCEGPTGSSKPVVLFESGAFGFAGDWAYVQSQLTAQGVRSCAYDRAGMGLSEPASAPRDGINVARDLEKLLKAANVPGPYVLVGHSMAGVRVHLFANRNRGKVAGLVLVDSTTPEATQDAAVMKYVTDFTSGAKAAALTARVGILYLLSGTALGDKVGLPPREDAQKRAQFASASYNLTSYEEVRNWPLAAAQARATGPLNPAWPVAVISAGVLSADEGAQIQALQPPPALASRHGLVSIVDGATHNGLLGAQYSSAIVQGIDFVLDAQGLGPNERAETVHRGLAVAKG